MDLEGAPIGVMISASADHGDRASAAAEIRRIEANWRASGRTVLDALEERFEPDCRYRSGDVWDAVTGAQYFYHAHPETMPQAEHGHFHCFLGHPGLPRGISPLVFPEMALALSPDSAAGSGIHRSERDRGVFSHLAALAIDPAGRPISLFTTNRWVTGETWFRAEDVQQMLSGFRFVAESDAPGVDRWLAATLRLLRPRILGLLTRRDAVLLDWRRRRARRHHVFEDRRLEILSAEPIDFAGELAAALRP